MNDTPRNPKSRTRPTDPIIAVLRELRTNLRNSIVAMEAALAALQPLENRAELQYIVIALRVATGRRGSSFGTAYAMVVQLDDLLGESGYAPEETTT